MRRHRQYIGVVILTGAFAACDDGEDLIAPVPLADISGFSVPLAELPADGVSVTSVQATVTAGTPLGRGARQVLFATSAGTFLPSNTNAEAVTADSSGRVIAVLRAPTEEGLAIVRASGGTTILVDSIRFVRAYPTSIELEPSAFTVTGTEEVTMTAVLRRDVGTVSQGTPVGFSARMPSGAQIGSFAVPSRSDSAGRVTVRFTPSDTSYRGPVIITATTNGDAAEVLSAETRLTVVAPPPEE